MIFPTKTWFPSVGEGPFLSKPLSVKPDLLKMFGFSQFDVEEFDWSSQNLDFNLRKTVGWTVSQAKTAKKTDSEGQKDRTDTSHCPFFVFIAST